MNGKLQGFQVPRRTFWAFCEAELPSQPNNKSKGISETGTKFSDEKKTKVTINEVIVKLKKILVYLGLELFVLFRQFFYFLSQFGDLEFQCFDVGGFGPTSSEVLLQKTCALRKRNCQRKWRVPKSIKIKPPFWERVQITMVDWHITEIFIFLETPNS